MFPARNTKDTAAIHAFVEETFVTLYPGASPAVIRRLFRDLEASFAGAHPDFAAADLRYHDWEHTLQATLCLTQMLEGRAAAGAQPRMQARDFELAIAAMLLHDSGYLKLRSDRSGTGAKYTFCHVLRSCAFAAAYLPTIGANGTEIDAVLAAISCTGPAAEINRLYFPRPVQKVTGAAVATADFLSQMAAPDYPDKLEFLYREFEESDGFLQVPPARRAFQSADDLEARTPQFWYKFVRPRLESDFQRIDRFLCRPTPGGDNPYLDAIEANIAQIQQRVARKSTRIHSALEPTVHP
jgi:hypothetical protein